MVSSVLNSSIAFEYIECCKDIKEYFKADTCEPPTLSKKYKQILGQLRDFLDDNQFKMPAALYPYDREDKTTWKYLDISIGGTKENKKYLGAFVNPQYKYKK